MFFLPLDLYLGQFLGSLGKYQIIIVTGDTGTGKTTRIPQYCFSSNLNENGIICCSQPRRLAVISAAQRTAFEMKSNLGSLVGYTIRFDNLTNEKTKIKFVTDGILFREWILNPYLDSYSILIIDEVHERCVYTDLILCLCKNLLDIRSNIKIIISSASINVEKFSTFFKNCPVFNIPSKKFLIKIFYNRFKTSNFLSSCYSTIIKIIQICGKKNVLVFLTGKDEIDLTYNLLSSYIKKNPKYYIFEIFPIYSGISWKIQCQVIKNYKKNPRIILATNIAEISLTIPDISIVIDSGFIKQNVFNPYFLINSLIIAPISKSNAIQRAGRTGRTKNGKCYRLYTKWSFNFEMNSDLVAEIQRTELCQIILFLKCLGINNFLSFDWIDPPSKIGLIQGLKKLYLLGAISIEGLITYLGRKMINYPTNPMLSKVIISSQKNKCTQEVISISAMIMASFSTHNLSGYQQIFGKKLISHGDYFILLHMFLEWKNLSGFDSSMKKYLLNHSPIRLANKINFQLSKILKNFELVYLNQNGPISFARITFSFLSGFFLNIGVLMKNGMYNLCLLNSTALGYIHPNSILNNNKLLPSLILYNELVLTSRYYLSIIMPLKRILVKNIFNIISVKSFL
nr:hypothetical protein 1634Bnrm1_p073 [Cryptomonas sp.]